MVVLYLQKDLEEEIKKITGEMRFLNPKGKLEKLNVFEQNLPVMEWSQTELYHDEEVETYQEEEMEESFPYCIVKLDSGKSMDAISAHIIKTVLIIGIYDPSTKMDGYKHILNIFEKIRVRFRKNPILNEQYSMGENVEWALPDKDEDTFPYFFGAMYLEWITAEVRREDSYS